MRDKAAHAINLKPTHKPVRNYYKIVKQLNLLHQLSFRDPPRNLSTLTINRNFLNSVHLNSAINKIIIANTLMMNDPAKEKVIIIRAIQRLLLDFNHFIKPADSLPKKGLYHLELISISL